LREFARHACVGAFYGWCVLASDLITQSATLVGLLAGSIAVGGFLGHAWPSMSGQPDAKLRRDTTVGGLYGISLAMGLILLSVFVTTPDVK
jgi:hypothetical protein